MKNCPKCGKELFDEAVICPNCGCPVEEPKAENNYVAAPKAIAYGAIALWIVATVLPLFKLSLLGVSKTVTMWDGDYKYVSIVGAILSVFLLLSLLKNKDSVRRDTILVGAVDVAEVIILYLLAKAALRDNSTKWDLSSLLSPDIGFYLLIISGIMLFIAGAMMKKPQK